MKETDDMYLFWEHQFGQWTKRDIMDMDGVVYNCCEQYMMAKKALLFRDKVTHQKIMQTDSPKAQQEFGREVKNFDSNRWNKNKYGIVWMANYLKFTQHNDLAERLLKTEKKILAEASPYDFVWGIGFAAEAEEALKVECWKGENLLGKILMSIREAITL